MVALNQHSRGAGAGCVTAGEEMTEGDEGLDDNSFRTWNTEGGQVRIP